MSGIELTTKPLRPVGGEVLGLVPGCENDPEFARAVYDAWLEYGILLFRNVESSAQHIALSRCLGELEIHPVVEARAKEDPLFIEIGGSKPSLPIVYDGVNLRINRIPWHRDTAFTPDICKGAMLRMLEIPQIEGETLLADTAAAYNGLPQEMKDRLETLEYVASYRYGNTDTRPGNIWKTARDATEKEFPGGAERRRMRDFLMENKESRFPSVIHPALLVHPEGGRKCIFLSLTHAEYFLGMERSESDQLLEYLSAHMTQPQYVYKHRWAVNDAIAWDNRRFMHASNGNKPSEPRRGLRTTLAGSLRVGRYLDKSSMKMDRPAVVD